MFTTQASHRLGGRVQSWSLGDGRQVELGAIALPCTTTDGIGDGEVSLVDGDGADGGNDHDGHLVDADLGGTGCSVDPW